MLYKGIIYGITIEAMNGDTWSLDYSSIMLWVQDVLGLGLCNGISREPIQGQVLGELPAAL